MDPQTLRGTNTGVYIGCSGSEATQAFGNDPETLVGYSITGTNRTMLANRVSYILDLKGKYLDVNKSIWGREWVKIAPDIFSR